jgi:hypothetical protein
MSTDNWMDDKDGVPHKNGFVRFYFIGYEESVFGYLGWHDMTDWDEGWKKVWAAAEAHPLSGNGAFQVLRHDQLQDLQRNVQDAFEEAMEDKDETTWMWWHRKETAEAKAKGEMK